MQECLDEYVNTEPRREIMEAVRYESQFGTDGLVQRVIKSSGHDPMLVRTVMQEACKYVRTNLNTKIIAEDMEE